MDIRDKYIEVRTEQGNIYYYSPFTNKLYPTKDIEAFDNGNLSFVLNETYSFDRISMFTIEVTQQCNLRCRYCCYSGEYVNHREHNSKEISWDDINKTIRFIGTTLDKESSSITVCFYGGEALLAKDKIDYFIRELREKYNNTPFEFSISTNGLLLTNNIIEWICSIQDLNVTITIDGDKVYHDKNRISRAKKGSYEMIMNNLNTFKKYYPKEYSKRVQFISTVQSISDVVELNTFWMNNDLLRDNRPKHISSIMPNFAKGEKIVLNSHVFYSFYRKAFVSYIKGDDNILTDELKHLVNIIERRQIFNLPKIQRLSTCINNPYSCFITAEGKLMVCEKMCENHSIGNLTEGIVKKICQEINNSFLARKNNHCAKCWANRLCRICATNLNNNIEQFEQYCESEKMQLKLALQFFCEVLEYKRNNKKI